MANALVLLGAGSSGSGTLTPPTVAPVLTVSADIGSYTATCEWTASNKTSSSGFGYKAYSSPDNITFTEFHDDNDLSANFSIALGQEGTWYVKVIPYNDAGEGPSSNTASVVLPGESNRLLLNAGGNLLLNQTGVLLING